MSTSVIEQKAYLQKKYLSGSSGEKKKKKKVYKGKGIKLIDDNIDLSKLRPLEDDELDLLGEGEDAPVVAGIIDERPEEVKKMEQFMTSSKWRVVTKDDGFNSKVQIEEIKKSVKEVEKGNETVFGKMYSDSEDEQKNDSDASPPRKKKKDRAQPETPPKRANQEPQPKTGPGKNSGVDHSPTQKHASEKRNEKSRKTSRWGDAEEPKTDSDSDMSPPRKSISKRTMSPSPPRKSKKSTRDMSPSKQDRKVRHTDRYKRVSDSPPPSNKKMAKTLEGKVAGLQDPRQLREENEAFRKLEDEAFKRLGDDVSGRNAKALSRKGKRETSGERQKLKEKAERQKELDEKYKKWNKGLKQVEAQESRVAEFMHEASKPVARYRDDADLEGRLRGVERAGDPMLDYIRDKKRQQGELPPEKPMYKGMIPLNRFNIRPGYRWDGVDRSNGYEKKYFEQQAKRKALQEEAYKWSTEDL